MPARGDHEQRRREVARIAAELVATGGLTAATHRRIAAASGCSTTVVSHYFANKQDLIRAIYVEVGNRVTSRLVAAGASTTPLVAVLEALLPLDEDRVVDWRLLFAFLGVAVTDPDLEAEQRSRVAAVRARIEQVITAEKRMGSVPGDNDPERIASVLLAVVLGIGFQALFDPAYWTPARIHETLNQALDDLGPLERSKRPPRRR
jgi:AcrR family transcriptional regulator